MSQLEVQFYYNTNQLKSDELARSIEKCKGQEKTVYEFFLNNLDSGYCWSEVLDRIGVNINACSLKRAITNLKIKGFLIKTEDRVMSKDGGLSHRYVFNKELLESF